MVDTNNTSGFGTTTNPPIVAIYTSAYNEQARLQAQSLAYSTDGGTTWTKYAGNPVLDIGSGEFRDPKVFWYAPAKQWRMVVVRALEHKVDIYGSPNLKNWTHLSDFGPAGAVGGVWECPDLFPLAVNGNPRNIKWVMVVNLNPGGIAGGSGGQYFVGDFDGTTFTSDDPPTYTPPTGTVLEDFETTTFAPWTTTGTPSATVPPPATRPAKAGSAGYLGDRLANSFHGGDGSRGTLTSPEFTISQDYLNFLVGGGNHPRVPGTTLDPSLPSGPVFADFEGDTWGAGWTATGDFVNDGPRPGPSATNRPSVGYQGERLVNTFTDHDLSTGTITSPTFTIDQNYINLLVGGGNHPYTGSGCRRDRGQSVVDGQVVRTATGQDSELRELGGLERRRTAGPAGPDPDRGQQHRRLGTHPGRPHHVLRPGRHPGVGRDHGQPAGRRAGGPDRHRTQQRNSWTGPGWDVRDLAGKTAHIQVIDNNTSGWGHILADQFTFADAPALSATQRAHWLDYGRDFYAGVTFNNSPTNKRIMIAWMNNWQYGGTIPTDPWRSAMSLPRELHPGRAMPAHTELRPPPFTSSRPSASHGRCTHSAARLLPGTTTLPAPGRRRHPRDQGHFRARDADKFGINVRVGNGEKTVIGYDVDRGGVYLDRTRSGNVASAARFPSTEFAPLKPDAER